MAAASMLAAALLLTLAASPGDLPASLVDARKLSDALRYEEAVVEYQRYLVVPDRPARERAAALFELGFIHLVLGDEVNASARALAALDLDPALQLSPSAPARQVDFLAQVKREFLTRARLTVVPREQGDAPGVVRAKVVDPEGRVKRVLLRHSLAANGPFWSTQMRCAQDRCEGTIPAPADSSDFAAWYFVEALDGKQGTVALGGSASEPLQLSVVGGRSWVKNPLVWGIGGAALIAVGAVVYLLAPPPPR